MPTDVFSRGGHDFKGSFAADSAKVVFAGGGDLQAGGVGLLTQNLSVNYTQQITRLYEIGSQNTYYVGGRTQGQATLGRVFGPRALQLGFYQKFGDVCKAADNTINFSLEAGCASGAQADYAKAGFTIHNAVITSMGFTVQAQDMIINEQVQLMFVALSYAS
jgi:hypothetical protein